MKWYFHSESMDKELEVKAIFLDTNKFTVQLNGWGTECLYGADKLLQAHDDAIRRETKEEYRSILETVVDQTRKECAKMIQHLSDQLGDDGIMIDTDRAMEQAYDLAISAIINTEPAILYGKDIKKTHAHDTGAYARCSYCGRYSDNPKSLRHEIKCDCGKTGGWSGSFMAPVKDSIWSLGTEPAREES